MSLTPPSYVDNPHLAYLWVIIGDQQLTLDPSGRPRWLVSFSFNRVTSRSGGSMLQIQIFDETWDTAEALLRVAKGTPIKFQYGYTSGVRSPMYTMNLIGAQPRLAIDGVEITIEAISSFVDDADAVRSETYRGMDIHEVVQAIADRRGWQTDLDPCDPVFDHHDLESSLPSKVQWQQQSMRDMQFIAEILVPKATRRTDHMAGYTATFDDATGTLHFHPPRLEQPEVKTYIFMRDPMSEVQSFTPDIPANLWLQAGAGSVGAPHIDLTTGEYRDLHVSDSTTPDKTILGGTYTITDTPAPEQYSAATHSPAPNAGQARMAAADRYFGMWLGCIGGTMVVQGEPQRRPYEIIRIIVTTRDGRLHQTSGLYLIRDITDGISGGRFSSTFTLQRSGFPATGEGPQGDVGTGKVRQ